MRRVNVRSMERQRQMRGERVTGSNVVIPQWRLDW